MTSTMGPSPTSSKKILLFSLLALVLIAVLAVGLWRWSLYVASREDEQLRATAKQYSPYIFILNPTLLQGENFLGDRVRFLKGTILNTGDRVIGLLEVEFFFLNQERLLVHRERQRLIDDRKKPLAPNETRDFQVGFENLPPTWNRQEPSFMITRVKLR